MKNLKIWQKLALMGAVFMLPFAVVTYKMASSIDALGVEFARQELRGVEYYTPLLGLLTHLQQHRGMTNAWLSGDSSFKDRVAGKSAEIENDLKRMDEVDQRLGSALRTSQQWAALNAACRDLLNQTTNLSPEDGFELHTKVIGDTIALITDVGDASNLTLDPDLDSYYLMNVLIFQGPELGELLAQARGLGSGMAAQQKGTAEQFERLNRLSILVAFLQKKMQESLSKSLQANAALGPQLETHTQTTMNSVQDAASYVRSLAVSRKLDTSEDYFAAMSRSVDAVFDVEADTAKALKGLLDKRIEKLRGEVLLTLAGAALGLLVVSCIGVFIVRDITVSLRQVVGIANQIASGDLTVQTTAGARKDEVGVLAHAFGRMVAGLKETVVAVQKSGIQVNTSVMGISATAKQQQATASEVAATTAEIMATSKEISATSRQLVKTMNEVSVAVEQTATLAGNGQSGLSRMDETMQKVMAAAGLINTKLVVLSEKAGNINQVVTTITKVADQTNLLSLNAAIEAEKAGEYGRGFAVVATEIRRLADQTAVATYDIEQMVREIQSAVSAGVMGMDKFSEEVRRGMQDVQQVGDQLSQIIHEVQTLAPRFEAVGEGMQAQAAGGEQISEALTQLGEASQQTVESLRQSSRTIGELNQVVGGLRDSVSRFGLQELGAGAV
nr:methyl-accepting chemotaxis protein [Pseudomonas sp. 2FE]